MTIQEVISRFNTTPFLFAGSGITRRYYGLPDWEGLLRHFANQVKEDRFAYNAYLAEADGDLPKAATLIERDYRTAWFQNPALRTLDEKGLQAVEAGKSPFKMEVAAFLRRQSAPKTEYASEIHKLKRLSKKNLSGVITTNYDLFFETNFSDYKTFVGQDNLVFSPIQGIAEIYKIHGSVSMPESIVINDADYQTFRSKGKYLAAKLMTIFMEYPIIFMGYSISDSNIQGILEDIAECIPESKLSTLKERFVFVDYTPGMSGYQISEFEIVLGEKRITMTKVLLEDFSILYDALTAKVAAIPVKMLRRFKEDLYTYTITNEPGTTLMVADLDSSQLEEDNLVISIAVPKTGEFGYQRLLDVNSWYHNVVFDDLAPNRHSYDKLLELTYPGVKKETTGYIPVCKYLAYAAKPHPEIADTIPEAYDDLFCQTNIKNRASVEQYASVADLWSKEKADPKRACRLLVSLPEEKTSVDELEQVLHEMFELDPDLLTNKTNWTPSDVKRLIRVYDYLKWGQKKT